MIVSFTIIITEQASIYHLFLTGTPTDSFSCYKTTMCNLWIYPWEINKDKLKDHTDVQFLNLTASVTLENVVSIVYFSWNSDNNNQNGLPKN